MLSLRPSRWLLFFLLVLGFAGGAQAQSQATTGVIEGTVLDESGGVIPGVTVTLKNTATNFERVVTTDVDGRFRGLLLPLGPYRVSANLTGFSTLIREGMDLSVGQTVNLRLTLKLSPMQESVTITAPAPLLETTRAEGSNQD